jgi:hypothetical protein
MLGKGIIAYVGVNLIPEVVNQENPAKAERCTSQRKKS